MRKLILFCTLVVVFSGVSVVFGDRTKEEGMVIFDQKYKLVEPAEEKEIGTYILRAVEKGGEITITDEITLKDPRRGENVGFKTKVKYKIEPALTPYHFEGETSMGDKTMMKGTMTVKDGKADFLIQGLCDRQGNPANPPLKMEKKGVELPKGALILPQHLRILGPRILVRPGELVEMLKVEFPDDLKFPEFINWKEGHKLIRERAGEDSSFVISLVSSGEEEHKWASLKFDSKGRFTETLSSSLRKWKEVPVEKTTEHQILPDLEKRLKKALKDACPKAEFSLNKGRLAVQHKTKKFQVHDRNKAGEVTPKTHEELGPEETGFILLLSTVKGDPKESQAVSGQTLKKEHWQTYIARYAVEWMEKMYVSATLLFGSKTDAKLLDTIKKTIADYAKKEN